MLVLNRFRKLDGHDRKFRPRVYPIYSVSSCSIFQSMFSPINIVFILLFFKIPSGSFIGATEARKIEEFSYDRTKQSERAFHVPTILAASVNKYGKEAKKVSYCMYPIK